MKLAGNGLDGRKSVESCREDDADDDQSRKQEDGTSDDDSDLDPVLQEFLMRQSQGEMRRAGVSDDTKNGRFAVQNSGTNFRAEFRTRNCIKAASISGIRAKSASAAGSRGTRRCSRTMGRCLVGLCLHSVAQGPPSGP